MVRTLETILDRILSTAAQNGILTAQALATKAGLAAETVSRIRSRGTADYRSISKLAEAAGMELVVQVAARPRPVERKSQALNLDFPYDWPNAQMDARVLIRNVLERNRFSDVARIAIHYGLSEVEDVANTSRLSARKDVARSLGNIRKAFAHASP